MFYEQQKQFVFPEIDAAWRVQQIQEIKKCDRGSELVFDGQFDSPGHSATYNTVSAIDTKNKASYQF